MSEVQTFIVIMTIICAIYHIITHDYTPRA